MNKLLASCIVASVLLIACNAGSGTKRSNAAAPASLPTVTAAPATNNATATGTTTAAPATNPPHGQPGHRCDLAVGAPLNSQPAPSVTIPGNQPQNNNITITPSPQKVTMPVPANNGNVRMNPPHGQPGHRCDVQVGQPLPASNP